MSAKRAAAVFTATVFGLALIGTASVPPDLQPTVDTVASAVILLGAALTAYELVFGFGQIGEGGQT